MEEIHFEKIENIGIIRLNRPQAYNSFTIPMAKLMQQHLDWCASSEEIRCIVITGNGKAFCAGQDLKEATSDNAPSIGTIVKTTYNPIIQKIRSIEKPIIASVNGVAAGAGANIAIACDICIAGETAHFIQSFTSIGLVPDSGGTFFLPKLIGMQRAMAHMILGDKMSAQQAEEIGMIYKTHKDDALWEKTMEMAHTLSKRPTKAIGLTKRAVNQGLTSNLETQLNLELELQEQAGNTYDNKEGVQAFLEKRKPIFKGH